MTRTAFALLAAAVACALLACSPEIITHGYHLDEAAITQIQPGRTTRDEVSQLLGSPSSLATFDDSIWYYVSQRTERMSFYQDDVVDQSVIAIAFDGSGVVQSVDRRGLADAREVALVERETPTSGKELNVLQQFLGNLGRFNPTETGRKKPGQPQGLSYAPSAP
jgi:outer membrane protein assembly factor BamE (lipoprotein component of BamABCDE complex)